MRNDEWLEITLRVSPADADAVADVLRDFAPDGVSIEPAIRTSDDRDFAYEYLDKPALIRACVQAPFEVAQRRALRRRLDALSLSAPLVRLRYVALQNTDWSHEWKRFFHVLRIGRLVVCPSWEQVEVAPSEIIIDLDPGAAFGTGQHETTRLCLMALDANLQPGARVIDLGTGSGILAIAAAKLGAASVVALDIDPDALAVARENIARNGVDDAVTLTVGSLPWKEGIEADYVVANISSQTVLALLPAITEALAPSGLAILSGFIEPAAQAVAAAARACGLVPLTLGAEGEWRCLVARKAANA